MFSSFSTSPLRAKRRRVGRACDFCRESRTRCEAITPCPQCVANHVTCIRPQSDSQSRSIHGSKRQSSPLNDSHGQDETCQISERQPQFEQHGSQDDVSTARQARRCPNVPSSAQRIDSMLDFIARINDFCAGVSQLTSSMPPGEDPPYPSPFLPGGHQDPTSTTDCSLTEVQIARLLLIFWTRLWPQVPIVECEDLRPDNHSSQDRTSPLRDAIIAYCMQYVYYSGLHSRILGLDLQQFEPNSQGSMIGLPYFQRCLSSVTQYTNFSQPSVFTLQCYCFMILYLLDAGQHSAAYNMIGLALRIAQSLDSNAGTPLEAAAQNFRRAWWVLNHLDFRCSRYLGKPVSIQFQEPTLPAQIQAAGDPLGLDSSLYHTETIRLTATALAIIKKIDSPSIQSELQNEAAGVESRAHLLSDELYHLRQWESDLQNVKPFRYIKLHVGDMPPDPDQELEVQEDYLKQPPMDVLLTTMLELQYHNVVVTLHRVFIQFPSHPLVPKASPLGDKHNATALNHALAMLRIINHRMTTHDILHGNSEIYQYTWNAVLTLVGFMLAYPYCYRCPRARKYIRLALMIFDSAGKHNTSAVRAASLTRHLAAKVDTLVQILNIDQPSVPAGGSNPLQIPILEAQATGDLPSLSTDLTGSEGQAMTPIDLGFSGDSLGSWADFMNVSAWPSYCDEVSEAFADPMKLPPL